MRLNEHKFPAELVTHVTEMCGARGERWFAELPSVIRELEDKWDLTVGVPFPGIEYNFVAEAKRSDGEPVVIKIAPPFETTEIFGEAKYLRLHKGKGAVRLLGEDREMKALLLERAIPGVALHQQFAAKPVECLGPAIKVLKETLEPPPEDMSDVATLNEWFERFNSHYDGTSFPAVLAERALEIYGDLSRQTEGIYYLHGDFHPGNIVSASREEFQVIDPKGIVGHIGYDIAVFLINLERLVRNDDNLTSILNEAIRSFSVAFDLTEIEIREWVFAHMVIGAWWNFEDMPGLYDPELAMPEIWHL